MSNHMSRFRVAQGVLCLTIPALFMAAPAEAQRLKYQDDGVEWWAQLSLSSQMATFNEALHLALFPYREPLCATSSKKLFDR